MLKIKYPAEICNLRKFKDFLNEYLQDMQIEDSRIQDIQLAVEELIVNVINYSYPESMGFVELLCEKQKDKLILKIIDSGIEFDPTKSLGPELDATLKDRSQGGMGIYLAKNLLDNMTYQRHKGENILSLIVEID